MIASPAETDRLIDGAVDVRTGLVARRIFSSDDIYQREQERIFRRCWLFLGHDSQIPKTGDYVTTQMADTSIILCRTMSGEVKALVNSCRHRGNTVCRTDAGNLKTFTCSYHGWAYDLQGKRVESGGLINVPGTTAFYNDKFKMDEWGLVPVPRVEAYRGLIFGSFDADAPSLETYLGDFRWALDLVLDRGDLVAAPGALRWRQRTNWKFAADNCGDMAHVQVTHRSAFIAMSKLNGTKVAPVGTAQPGFTLLTEYGHMGNFQTASVEDGPNADIKKGFKYANAGAEYWRNRPEIVAAQGPLKASVLRYNMHLFPNLFILDRVLMVRNPLGPGEMEQRILGLYDRSAPEEIQRQELRSMYRKFGPSGLLEQEDGENFTESTRGVNFETIADKDLNYEMGIGAQVVDDGASPPRIPTMFNEHGQRWFYQAWSQAMESSSWDDFSARQARAAGTF
jgi:phenylpropionate dioxygenase-like ring-hydroxylating dioxygenase large terminal subunit